jgi:two-component system LytT family response regulator
MAEIRAFIVDDEPLARRGIRQLLSRHPDITVAGEYRYGREAIKASESLACELMFLDVQMPGMSGFDVVRQWVGDMPVTVFVTAYQEFAVRAFESCALDYLVKPVSQARFDAAMVRVRERIRLGQSDALAARLSALLEGRPGLDEGRDQDTLVVPTPDGRLALDPLEIDWIEARDYYSCIHAGSRRYLMRESMRALEKRLDRNRFVRVHRGAIVRLAQIREIRTSAAGGMLVLKTGTRIPVSRRRREQLNRAFLGDPVADRSLPKSRR